MAKRRDPNSAHYIDNKEFLKAMTIYRESRLEAEESGEDRPQVTNYIGECFVKIANHLAYKSNFVNYTFRDEMILDGIENCLDTSFASPIFVGVIYEIFTAFIE